MRIKVLSGGRKSIELPLSDAELNFQMKRIGIEETVPVCRLVEASEKDNPLCKFEGQTVNMDEVNFFAKRMDCLTEYERKVLYSYVTDYGVGTMQDLINLTFSMKGLSLITDFSDAEQVGKRLYLDEFIAMPEEEKQQTNFIKFAEKTFKESRVEVLPYGVFVEHGFEMQEVYNGKTFPEYFASDEIVAAIEVQNQAGDTEYLYLPTDICSMNKVKERLQVMDFWEMKVTDIHNIRLPDILVPMPENIDCVEALTLFNETCQAVRHFDEVQMKQLAMVVEFTGFSSHTEVTSLAKLLGEFEVNPFVHNDEEYGKYMVEESGLFDVDELLLPHINYASFAADKRQGTLVTNEILEKTDFKLLNMSCNSENTSYAAEKLFAMHQAFEEVYGEGYVEEGYGMVMMPAVIRGRESGIHALAVVTLDLESSGEHWGTTFLSPGGPLVQGYVYLTEEQKQAIKEYYVPYDYWYTPLVERDNHVDFTDMPDSVANIRKMVDEYLVTGQSQAMDGPK